MMTSRKFISALMALCLLFTQVAASAATTISACSNGTIVYYLNGVNKPIELQVARDARRLQVKLGERNAAPIKDVSYLYNPSDTLLLDVFSELSSQYAAARNAQVADVFVSVGLSAWGYVTDLTEAEQTQIRARVANTVSQFSLSATFSDLFRTYTTAQLVNQFADLVSSDLSNGTKVVIVSHSQGNLFANEVHTNILGRLPAAKSRGLAVANIANAAPRAPSGLYVTITQDLVINVAARVIAGSQQPMVANTDGTGALSIDRTGHGFTEVYLSTALPTNASVANSVGAKVLATVEQAVNVAVDPQRDTTDGPITATLNWSSAGDVDLHITEPVGTHIYYASRFGQMGELDKDDTVGTGPEHYYTSCARELAVGSYVFGVNYFSGTGPRTATIQIKTPRGTESASIGLGASRGPQGDNSPMNLLKVDVTKDANGLYQFVTQQL